MTDSELPWDYIRGLVEGGGTFTFDTRTQRMADGSVRKVKTPTSAVKMHKRDEDLLKAVKSTLGLPNTVYNFDSHTRRRPNSGRQAMLIVREYEQLRDVIIPFFYKKLRGNKSKQFEEWLERMGDPNTSKVSKALYWRYKSEHYDKSWNKCFD